MDTFIVGFWGRTLAALRWLSPLEWLWVLRPGLRTHFFVDIWASGNLILSAVTLVLAGKLAGSALIDGLAIYGAIRVFEVVVYQCKVVLFDPYRSPRSTTDYAVRSYRRTVVLGLQNYFEVAVWFAAGYCNYRQLFCDKTEVLSTCFGAVYFSLVTMTTLGYGEVTPSSDPGRGLVTAHLVVAVFMTLLILTSFVSYLRRPRETGDSPVCWRLSIALQGKQTWRQRLARLMRRR